MKTKIFLLLAALSFSATAFAQEAKTMYVMKDGAITHEIAVSEIDSIIFYKPLIYDYDEGVIINGVKWATRNVALPGTFVDNPEDLGMFYQWNRKVAWPTTVRVTNWDSSTPTGTIWEKSNDPSPDGWRVPSSEEVLKLFDKEKVTSEWAIVNGVNGKKFIDKITGNLMFLPAAGYRRYYDGLLDRAGLYGCYWGLTRYDSVNAYCLYFDSGTAGYSYFGCSNGYSVRSVADI